MAYIFDMLALFWESEAPLSRPKKILDPALRVSAELSSLSIHALSTPTPIIHRHSSRPNTTYSEPLDVPNTSRLSLTTCASARLNQTQSNSPRSIPTHSISRTDSSQSRIYARSGPSLPCSRASSAQVRVTATQLPRLTGAWLTSTSPEPPTTAGR